MSSEITIVDYGVGNLLSVSRALEHVDGNVVVTSKASTIIAADRIVLPGVGAFGHGMQQLHDRGLILAIKEFLSTNRPFLGICLGMQMMMDSSREFGKSEGLGLIDGECVPIPTVGVNGKKHKVPHIGWNSLIKPKSASWYSTILEDIEPGAPTYFIHLFVAEPSQPDAVISYCDYNGIRLTAVIQKDLQFGVQFHPEKSGEVGLKILRNFVNL